MDTDTMPGMIEEMTLQRRAQSIDPMHMYIAWLNFIIVLCKNDLGVGILV